LKPVTPDSKRLARDIRAIAPPPVVMQNVQTQMAPPSVKPQIIIAGVEGAHNFDLEAAASRISRGGAYKNAATICVVPTLGSIHYKVVQSWMGLMTPMNQPFVRLFVANMEVGAAYSSAIELILNHPQFKDWPYLLTLETDNMPPPDGLLKLIEAIDGGMDGNKYDAVGGLYWTKGEGGQPMCYGDPNVMPKNFVPQIPRPDTVQPCNGLGMGFTLFRIKMFKDSLIPRPWFRTVQEWNPQAGGKGFTQDLFFFNSANACGYKFACDTRVKVGHYDANQDKVW